MENRLNSKGQATVEAILMLILGVSMVMGLMHGFSKSFSAFTEIYFGEYFSCLIEHGELPRLKYVGGEGPCDKKFKSFSLVEGWAKNSAAGKSVAIAGSGNKSSSKGSGLSRRPTQGVNEGGSSGQRFVINSRRGRGAGASSSSSEGKEKSKLSPSDYGGKQIGTYGAFSDEGYGGVQIIRIKRNTKDSNGSSYSLYKDPKDKKVKITGGLDKGSQFDANAQKAIRLKIDRTTVKIKKKKDTGFQFSFSSIMRFLIITALIIVIIIVIGGQLLSISKSFE